MNLNIDKNLKYVIACSYGPDSMALLDMALKDGLNIVVAHVNYHKRDISNFEEQSLKEYCKKNNIIVEVFDTANLKEEGNFQNWARKVRYEFFKSVAQKHNADAVLVAHQQDDLIETYLMQKERKNFVKNPGIAEETTLFGIRIIRPLLAFSKKDLSDYDKKNNVPYSIDESNLSDKYERNKIRHQIVEKMSSVERDKIIKELSKFNSDVSYEEKFSVNEFLNLDDEEMTKQISMFIEKRREHKDLSLKFINEIRKAVISKKNCVDIDLGKDLSLVKEYGYVLFIDKKQRIKYRYLLKDKNEVVSDNLFDIDFHSNSEDRNVTLNDFPITIEPINAKDRIQIDKYECEVRRLFIDWKVPHYLRDCWPGIYNKDGKLIYIPRYREKFEDNHQSVFKIKFVK